MTNRIDDWIFQDAEELADSGGMPPPNRPSLPTYAQAQQYTRPWRLPGDHTFHIGSVGRREGRVQPIAPRSPIEFDSRHGVFDRVRFGIMPIPSHAMGVAYVNYPDRLWLLARRAGYTHVEFREGPEPFTLYRARIGQFIDEAVRRVGARGWNTSRWFYFRWDPAQHGNGDHIL